MSTGSEKVRVLIVEDDPDGSYCLEQLVSFWGHETRVAATGAEAMEVAAAFAPQVVLLDFQLPDVDGPELAERLRSEGGDDLLIVAITAFAFPEYADRAYEAGMDLFMLKPVDYPVLEKLLKTVPPRS